MAAVGAFGGSAVAPAAPPGELVAGEDAEQRTEGGDRGAEDGQAKLDIGPDQELDVQPG